MAIKDIVLHQGPDSRSAARLDTAVALAKTHDARIIEAFVTHYNHHRYHESLNNLTPANVYFGRGQTILLERERIKRKTIERRRLQHRKSAA